MHLFKFIANFLLILILASSCGKKEYPVDPEINTEILEFRQNLRDDITNHTKRDSLPVFFEWHTRKLLDDWENQAPEEVQQKIEILKAGETMASADAAEALAEMGTFGKGASKALMKTLGNAYLIRHGDIPRLFGAKDFTAGNMACKAFYSIGNPSIPALICSLYIPFDDEVEEFGLYRKQNAKNTLGALTGQNYGYNAVGWIKWYVQAPEGEIIFQTEQPKTEVKSEKLNDTGETDYFDNEFLWALIVGAIIVIFFGSKKAMKK